MSAPNWAMSMQTAWMHGVAGAFAASVLGDAAAPDEAQREAREIRATTLARHLCFTNSAVRLHDVLDHAGVPHAFVKGPIVAELHHREPCERAYVDLDVLVPPEVLGESVRVLSKAGFTVTTRNWKLLLQEMPGEMSLEDPDGVPIDLHWSLINTKRGRALRRLETASLLSHVRDVEVQAAWLPTLDRTDTLIHLCVHAADSGGDRLLWPFDIHCAIAAEEQDWHEVVRRARQYRVSGQVALMCERARRAFGTVVPDFVVADLGQRTWTRLDALIDRVSEPWSTYPRGSVSRSFARATRERPSLGLAAVLRRGAAWAFSGAALRTPAEHPFMTPDDPGSGLFDGGGRLDDYLAAVQMHTQVARGGSQVPDSA